MHKKLLLIALTAALVLQSAFALDTRINVSLSEVVYNNITYARDFDLVEANPYCEILGTMVINNPSADSVFDIYVSFTNINRMTTDFEYFDGKPGAMFSGASGRQEAVSQDVGNNTNNYTMLLDLDGDTETDYFYINSTHALFNISSESGLIAINLTNSTGDNVDISSATPAVDLDVDGMEIIGSRTYGNLTIIGSTATDNVLPDATVVITISRYPQGPIVIHIPELRPDNYTTFKYNVTCANTDPPINLESNYSNDFHQSINKKVLAGLNWTVTQHARNDFYLNMDVTNVNITIMAQSVIWNETAFNFSLEEILALGDYAHTDGNGTSNLVWTWAPNGGTLTPGMDMNISYIVRAPYSVPFTATYLAIIENLTYDAPFLMSNLSIIHINGSANLNHSFEKHIYQPSDNDLNPNVTWEIRPHINVPIDISYELNKVTLWVTQTQDPNAYTGLNKTVGANPLAEINMTSPWGIESDYWYFNYTDGSNSTNPPPIVWMKPEWLITNRYGQILNYSRTVNGNDLYIKYIYVINGYWLEVNKNITSVGEDRYRVYVYVENIGNGWTPIYEYVTVYDFVPSEFGAGEFTDTTFLNESVGTPGSDYYGMAYQWNVPWKGTMNSSLGPRYGPDETVAANYSWNVTYYVNGSGDYKVTELYIIGLDPLRVDGASASPVISIMTGIQSHSRELIYVGVLGFLIVLNVTNLIMTNRINRKLDHARPIAKYKLNSKNR